MANPMEGLYLKSTTLSNIVKYYALATNKQKLDINKLLLKSDKGEALTKKEFDRLNKYSFRYKMYMQHISENTDRRLNKLNRKSLTTPNKDAD